MCNASAMIMLVPAGNIFTMEVIHGLMRTIVRITLRACQYNARVAHQLAVELGLKESGL